MKIFPADDEGSVHLSGDYSACEDTATNRDLAGKWTFLVYMLKYQ